MKLGQYELLDRIAVGGMAEIYRGRAIGEEGFEKPVAIKRILPHFVQDSRFVSMLVTEARIHASLSHRNIVQIHDLGISEEGEYFIVLEYVDGRDLGALLGVLGKTSAPGTGGRTLRPSDALALYVVTELAEGVHFAHELCGPDGQPLGLIHRDISPTNVLVSYASEVKLSDFGLAKRRNDQSVVGSIKGKLAYMSPEQARRSPLDRRSDIFSMGAVLFEMLTGHRLRELPDDVQGWQMVGSGLLPQARTFRPDLPPVLDQLLARALAVDPADRFPDALTFGTEARKAMDMVPRAATSESSELQGLMRTLLPPGSPREDPKDASRVIRLVSEFIPVGPPPKPLPPRKRRTTPRGVQAPQGSNASPTPLVEPSFPPAAAPVGHPDPERAPVRSRGFGASALIITLLIALPIALAIVHYTFVPLPVLRVWLSPARLNLDSRPPGAAIYLDGHRLERTTPTSAEVHRDRHTHVVELWKEGFQRSRLEVRYDRAAELDVSVTLDPEKRPSFEPIQRQR